MRWIYIRAIAVAAVLATTGCGFQLLDRWDGRTVAAARVDAPADRVWEEVVDRLETLDLTVSQLEPESGVVALAWITAPGDGAEYVECAAGPTVGSASLLPRVVVTPQPDGTSRVAISSVVRATAAESCRSTGRYEEWLLARLQVAGPGVAASRP